MKLNKQDIYKALETITAPGEGKSLVESENITIALMETAII